MAANLLPLSRYVYGTTRLGDESIPAEDRIVLARKAIDAGLTLHTSDQYGNTLDILRAAFDRDRSKLPPLIIKIGWDSVEQVKGQIEKQLETLGLESLAIGQLCLGGELAENFKNGGSSIDHLNKLKESGLVRSYVLETWPWTSTVPLEALQKGHAAKLVDALIFYLNPMQRFVTNPLWDWIVEHQTPVIAMRTVCGGSVEQMRDDPGLIREYLKGRAVEVAPLYEKSGAKSWPEFCVRYAFGFPFVLATVGATASHKNFDLFLQVTQDVEPLRNDTNNHLIELQRRWSEEHDQNAEPWSM